MLKLLTTQPQLEVFQKSCIHLNFKKVYAKNDFFIDIKGYNNFIKNRLVVLKPIHGHSGNDILFLNNKSSEASLKNT